jgi:hypothetical protein
MVVSAMGLPAFRLLVSDGLALLARQHAAEPRLRGAPPPDVRFRQVLQP